MQGAHQHLADAVLVLHALFVAFVVVALLLILVGGFRRWRWVRNWWFRATHLACIGIVVAQAWFGLICPLTSLEMWFRTGSGAARYEGSFIQYWLHRLLYYDAPGWVFVLLYTSFGLLVLLAWLRFPPRSRVVE